MAISGIKAGTLGGIHSGSISGSKISGTTMPSSFALEELAESSFFAPANPDRLTKWSNKSLHSLFGLGDWESTQLYQILEVLEFNELKHCYLAGGSLVRHLMGTEIAKGDIDLYFTTKDKALAAVKFYEDKRYKLTKHKYSYQFEIKIGIRNIKVQIIAENTGSVGEVLSKFDFEHVRLAYYQGSFISTMGATTSIAQKKLHLRYVKEPNYTLLRALKYKKMGFDADQAINTLAVMINKEASNVNAAEWEETNPIMEY